MIRRREIVYKTAWFEVEAKITDLSDKPFYSLKIVDYVCVVATTEAGEMILVRQYRPAIERETLELPSGLVDGAHDAAETAKRELEEETGYTADVIHLGTLQTDTGRLQNRLWCYAARGARKLQHFAPEPSMSVVLMRPDELRRAIKDGTFDHALHLAALQLAEFS